MILRLWWAWLLLPGFVMAVELPLIGDTVQLHGKIVAQPCVVAPGSTDQTVAMGAFSKQDLEQRGSGPRVPFKIRLTGCGSVASKANFTFTGTQAMDKIHSGLAFTGGSARGGGIFLEHQGSSSSGSWTPIQIGAPVGFPIQRGDNELTFYAKLGRTYQFGNAVPITPGNYSAVATFVVTYQ